MASITHPHAFHFDRAVDSYWEASADPLGLETPQLKGEHSCDVAVIGFGATGACAAIEAARAGARVLLFERNSGSGGASGLSGGEIYIGGNGGTEVQRAAGFEDSTDTLAGPPA